MRLLWTTLLHNPTGSKPYKLDLLSHQSLHNLYLMNNPCIIFLKNLSLSLKYPGILILRDVLLCVPRHSFLISYLCACPPSLSQHRSMPSFSLLRTGLPFFTSETESVPLAIHDHWNLIMSSVFGSFRLSTSMFTSLIAYASPLLPSLSSLLSAF